jgi:RecB family endonuclease NucS
VNASVAIDVVDVLRFDERGDIVAIRAYKG